ncbi:MAG: hypothetical protein JNK95_01675 [Candidatus Competibacter sp.]|nr:hypothetical protein [Candidatus Competibacter sp.]MDG4605804.1 hypothetical protein [Candidatus Contendobacter sp.]
MIDPNAKFWFEYTDACGSVWKTDWVGVYRILRAYARSKEVLKHSKVIKRKPDFRNVSGGFRFAEQIIDRPFLPTIEHVEVDWLAVEKGADLEAARLAGDIWRNWLPSSGERTIEHLIGLRKDTLEYDKKFWKQSNDAWRGTMAGIGTNVKTLEEVKKGLEIVRNASADILMVGATFLSGGALAGVLGARGFIKGAARYADTENIGFAVLEGGMQMVFGLMKVKVGQAALFKDIEKGAAVTTNLVIGFVEAQHEVAMAIGSGKSISEALKRGGLKMGESAIGEVSGYLLSQLPWSNLAIPITINTKEIANALAKDAMTKEAAANVFKAKTATTILRRSAVEGAKATIESLPRKPEMPALPRILPQPAISDGYVPAERIIRNMLQRVPRTESGQPFPVIPPPPAHR